jgi:hypothetical protein
VREAPEPPLTRDALRTDLLGCYTLFDEKGLPAEARLTWVPAIVRLDSAAARMSSPTHGTWRWAERLGHGGEALPDFGRDAPWANAWAADSLTDSIRVDFSNGLGGSGFVLDAPAAVQGADTLHGRARAYYDSSDPEERGRASAVRVECPLKVETVPPAA